MLRIAVIIAACVMSVMAQTTISDTILSPFGGGNWTGKIRLSCPRTTSTTGGTIALETYSATVTNGVLSITIRPYDTASPSSTCTARYEGATGVWQESWLIPTSGGAVKVSDILRPAPSSGTVAYVPAPPVCAVTPPTTGAYRNQCLGTDKKVYTCANSSGCTLAGDWGAGGGTTLPSVTNLLAGDGSGGASDSGLSVASVATLSGTQSLTNKTLDGISPTIMGYLANVSSDIQSQIGAKFTDPLTTRGDLIYRSAGGTTRLALGASGYCLTSDGTDAAWTTCPISGISSTQYMLPVSSSTAGQLGTSTTLLNGGIFYPSSDSITAIKFNKADGATNVVTVDTTNARLGIGSSSPGATLDVAKTSTYTARFYDQTATTGTTRVVLRAGAGDADGDKLFEQFLNDGTTSKFSITRGGTVTSVLFTGTDFSNANNRWRLDGTSSSAYGLALAADSRIMFSRTNSAYYDTKDAGLSRNSAGVVEINSGTTGRFADIKVRHLRTGTIATYAPAPTISSGFGTSPSIAGSDSAGRVTIGNPTGTSGVIAFGTAWATAPACTANDEVTGVTITTASTTTQLTLAGSFVAADTVVFTCIGY